MSTKVLHRSSVLSCVLLSVVLGLATGCAVPQHRGDGQMLYRHESSTGAGYYLYLPRDYVESEGRRSEDRKWPIVVTFHGMRPFDSSGAQIVEWQQEADRYGYVVIAPDLNVSDLLGEIPLKRVSPWLRRDQKAVMAILDEICQTLDVDPNHVLSTSWSMGGYLAHYFPNQYPDRFSCVAVRQSNFSADILDPAQIPQYRDDKIAIFYTQNDLAICRRESKQAIEWYHNHGFETTSGIVEGKGHERTPQTAAAFFARTCDAQPKTPPTQLAHLRITNADGSAISIYEPSVNMPRASDQTSKPQDTPTRSYPLSWEPISAPVDEDDSDSGSGLLRAGGGNAREEMLYGSAAGRNTASPSRRNRAPAERIVRGGAGSRSRLAEPFDEQNHARPLHARPLHARPLRTPEDQSRADSTEEGRFNREAQSPLNPLRVRISGTIGISPMLVSYTVQMPRHIREGADILWLDNGKPISRGISGQKSLVRSGNHRIEVLVITKQNQEYRASTSVTVLERLRLEDS